MSDPTYRLLLELAGRVDDDLLAAGRELVAVGEEGHALELVVAELVAGRTVLPPAVRSALVAETAARRIQPDADRGLPPAGSTDELLHRFIGDGPPEQARDLAAALAGTSAPGGGWSLAWRVTPAGAAPGPLPQPVLLGRAGSDESAEVLTYQAQSALGRAGLAASVEVHDDGDPDTTYHRAAWAVARPLPAGPVASHDRPTGGSGPSTAPAPNDGGTTARTVERQTGAAEDASDAVAEQGPAGSSRAEAHPTAGAAVHAVAGSAAAAHDGTPVASEADHGLPAGGPDEQLPPAAPDDPAPATHDVRVHHTAAGPAEPSATSGHDALRPGTGADGDLPARLHTAIGSDGPSTDAIPGPAGTHTTPVATEQDPADRSDGWQHATGSPEQPEQDPDRPTDQQPADRSDGWQHATGSPDQPEQDTVRPVQLLATGPSAGPDAAGPAGDGRPAERSAPDTAADGPAAEEPTGTEPAGTPDDEAAGVAAPDPTGATGPDVAEERAEQDPTTTVLPRRGVTDRTRELPFRDRNVRPGRSTSRTRYANVTSLPGIAGPGVGTPPRRLRDTAAGPTDAAAPGTPGPQADPAGPGPADGHGTGTAGSAGAGAGAEPSPTGPLPPHTAGPAGIPTDTEPPAFLPPDAGSPNSELPDPGLPHSGLANTGLADTEPPNPELPDGLPGRVTPLRTGSFPPPAAALNGVTDPTGPPEPAGPGGVPRDVQWGATQAGQGPAAPDIFGTPPVGSGPEPSPDEYASGPGPHLLGPGGATPFTRGPAGPIPPTDTAADGTGPIPPVRPPPPPAGQDGPGLGPAPGAGMFDAVVPGPGGHRPAPGDDPTPAGPGDDPTGAGHPAPRPSPPIRALRRATGDWFDADDHPREAGPTGAVPGAGAAPSAAGSAAPGAPRPEGDHGYARTGTDPGPAEPPAGRPEVPGAAEDAWQQDWASGAWVGDVLPVADPVPGTELLPTADGAEIDAPTPPPGVPIAYAPPVPTSALPTAGPQGPRHLLLTEDSDDPGQDDPGYGATDPGTADYGTAGYADSGHGDSGPDGSGRDGSGRSDTGLGDTGLEDTGQADTGQVAPGYSGSGYADDGHSNDDRDGEGHDGVSSGAVGATGADTSNGNPGGMRSGAAPAAETPGDIPEIPRPTGGLADRLSPTEHDLLQRLHEELAARENGGEPTPRNGTARPDRN
ncbi:hypothetical protein SAMN05216207_101044 [Pseudonocardia ammonioxydans]|uniref:Uncharacterized protein n=1 Tax=Pseudonocardia ammonioxydans TaxID=260086 RepID=A0A1I4X3L0_PSUAM|nr:hypothetical protein [Pseudonocardia ammonioxydans]SFN20668.1 hypothetical protein SAMN05216207_101044 [Pseudonocardia ammonioxydans]